MVACARRPSCWHPSRRRERAGPDEHQEDDWLSLAAPTVLGLAVETLMFVVRRRPFWAALSLAAEAVIGVPALGFALNELSARSETEQNTS